MTHGFKQVLVIRKDLNMRKGKMVAQGSHASVGALFARENAVVDKDKGTITFAITPEQLDWFLDLSTKIVVGVPGEQELLDIYRQCKEKELPCVLIQDRGLTEFGGVPTYTAVGIGPARADLIDPITGKLSLM